MLAFNDAGVRRNQIARHKPNPIVWNNIRAWNFSPNAVAQNSRSRSHALAQPLNGTLGMVGLNEVDRYAQNNHRHNDRGVHPFPDHRRNNAGNKQDRNERIREGASELGKGRRMPGRGGLVGPNLSEARTRDSGSQTVHVSYRAEPAIVTLS